MNIIDTTNDPCILDSVNTLKILDTSIPKIIRDFFDTIPAFKMIIGTETFSTWTYNPSYNNYNAPHGGETIGTIHSDTFNVRINKYYNKATDLAIAATIIHEAFHCQLINWVRRVELLGDTAQKNELARKYGFIFERGLVASDNNLIYVIANAPITVQHQTMANNFINEIAAALKNFGDKKGISAPIDYYKKLAWSGCIDSKAFETLDNISQNEIRKVIFAEKDPASQKLDPDGTPLNSTFTTPKGHRCP
ncbi:MAG: hypothetical protein EOO43_07530 [Flavobacterium sp.]|nr:MAG: hypothetical protein EOO43_07530 [Flavobacterium sp.]